MLLRMTGREAPGNGANEVQQLQGVPAANEPTFSLRSRWLLITTTKSQKCNAHAGGRAFAVRNQSDRSTSGVGGVCGHFKRPVIRDDRFVMSRSCDCMSVGTTLVLLI